MKAAFHHASGKVLCIDLDGTLVRGDTLHEGIFSVLARKPWAILSLIVAAFRGKANLKRIIAEHSRIDSATLPYSPGMLQFIHEQRAQGRAVVLVTGAAEKTARAVADHLGVFDDALSTNDRVNLTGPRK